MKKLYILSLLLFVLGCEDETDNIPPEVKIISPESSSVIGEIVKIGVMASDNKEVKKVELWVDGVSTGLEDKSSPYEIEWNTTTTDDGEYSLVVRCYDSSDNIKDSEVLKVTVDNTLSYPTASVLYDVKFQNASFVIEWSENKDEDFKSYKLFESDTEEMLTTKVVFESENRSDTTFTQQNISTGDRRYYQIIVEDAFSYQAKSEVKKAQSTTLFSKPFGGAGNDFLNASAEYDGRYYFVGTSDNGSGRNFWILTISSDGELEVSREINAPNFSNLSAITFKKNSFGATKQWVGGYKNDSRFVAYMNPRDESFLQEYTGNGIGGVNHLLVDGNGTGFWLGYQEVSNNNFDIAFSNLEVDGATYFGGEGWDGANHFIQTSDFKLLLAGRKNYQSSETTDAYFIKLKNTYGEILWEKTYGGAKLDRFNSVVEADNQGLTACGISREQDKSNDIWVVHTDSDGNQVWEKYFGTMGIYENCLDIVKNDDGSFLLAGEQYNPSTDMDLWIIKIDSNGDEIWSKTYGGADKDRISSMIRTSDGGYLITARTKSFGNGGYDGWVLKIDENGNYE